MEKEFCTHPQSLALKELGFNEMCFGTYRKDAVFSEKPFEYDIHYHTQIQLGKNLCPKNSDYINDWVSAPTFSQALRFFREKYSLKHDIEDDNNKGEKFYYKIKSFDDKKFDNYNDVICFLQQRKDWSEIEFDSYEKAESACLDKLIEIVKRKENEKI